MNLNLIKKQKGFTMIELVIVIAILAILAAFALPRFANIKNEANTATAEAIVAALNVSFSVVKAKYVANGSIGTSIDLDDNPATTDDIIAVSTGAYIAGNVNMNNILGQTSCQRLFDALLPQKNNLQVNGPRRSVCELENENFKITMRNSGPTVEILYK